MNYICWPVALCESKPSIQVFVRTLPGNANSGEARRSFVTSAEPTSILAVAPRSKAQAYYMLFLFLIGMGSSRALERDNVSKLIQTRALRSRLSVVMIRMRASRMYTVYVNIQYNEWGLEWYNNVTYFVCSIQSRHYHCDDFERTMIGTIDQVWHELCAIGGVHTYIYKPICIPRYKYIHI